MINCKLPPLEFVCHIHAIFTVIIVLHKNVIVPLYIHFSHFFFVLASPEITCFSILLKLSKVIIHPSTLSAGDKVL